MRKSTIVALVLVSLVAIMLIFAPPVKAQQANNCASFETVTERLTGPKFGEAIQSMAPWNGDVIIVWANTDTGTWTHTATAPSGNTCVLAAGSDYDFIGDAPGKVDPAGSDDVPPIPGAIIQQLPGELL